MRLPTAGNGPEGKEPVVPSGTEPRQDVPGTELSGRGRQRTKRKKRSSVESD